MATANFLFFRLFAKSAPSLLERTDYRADVDGLRAIAVLAVVGFHAAPRRVPGGFCGVDVFFVISGFLISSIIFRELSRSAFSFARFYARRAKRIFPSLIVVLLAVWALGWLLLLPDEYQQLGMNTLAGAGFTLNLLLYRDLKQYFWANTPPLLHLWSLGVEEQFYLLWPVFVVALWRLAKGRLFIIIIVAAASFALNLASITSNPLASFYLPTSRLWEFAMGGVLAYVQAAQTHEGPTGFTKTLQPTNPLAGHAQGIVGAALLGVSFVRLNRADAFPGWWALAPTIGALMLISAGPKSWFNRVVLASPLLVAIGLISYPLYLWHWPLLVFAHLAEGESFSPATAVCVVAAAGILSCLTYKYIEVPLRFSARGAPVALALSIVLILCAGVGYLNFSQRIPARSAGERVQRFLRAATENFPPKTNSEWDHLDSFITVGKGTRHVVFIGDSNVFQYYSRIDLLLSSQTPGTHDAVFATRSGCALPTVDIVTSNSLWITECRKYLPRALRFASGPDVDTVVFGGTWYSYFVDSRRYGESAPLRPDTDRVLEIMRKTMTDLVRAGKRVYVILQIPIGQAVDPRQMIRRTILPPGFEVTARPLKRAEVDKAIGPIDTRLRRVAEESGAEVIDPLESLCDMQLCPTVSPDDEPMYHDSNHLLPSYVREHVKYLDKIILDTNTKAAVIQEDWPESPTSGLAQAP